MNSTEEFTDPYSFEDFAPTLSQCFVLVGIGYLLSKFEILTASDVKGVIALASYFAMPGIICVSLMDADFSDFRWELLIGILLGKFFIFVIVSGFWILLKGNIGVAGVIAFFCTQSNDLPVGNPLMSSLYKNYRPQMMKYLFLIPATTVIFFVPISNIMISIHRQRQKRLEDPGFGRYWLKYLRKEDILHQLREIAKNPVVISTVCGLVLNFALNEGAPEALHQPIKVAAATIPGIALVMLGFSFVRKERYLISSAVVPAAVLFVLKMIITPIMFHSILRVITEESKSSKLLSDFALLYGIISPATTIFTTGREFRKALAAMSVALILSSFTCFPVSFFVACVTIAPVYKLSSYVPVLKGVLFWVACISICCNVMTGILIVWKNQFQKVSSYILHLLITQTLTCSGLILWSITERQMWTIYCEMVLYYGGEISGYFWTGTLAIILANKHKNWMLTKQGFFIISCTTLSVSATIIIVMCLLIPYNAVQTVYVVERARSDFEFLQLIMASILLYINLIIVAASLTYHFKNDKKGERKMTEATAYDNTAFCVEDYQDVIQTQNSKDLTSAEKVSKKAEGKVETDVYSEETLKNRTCENRPLLEEREWTFRLSSLIILLGLTMLVRCIANLFKLFRSDALEVMIPMEFLQSILFIGQGIYILLTFGIDIRTALITLKKWCRKIMRRDNNIAAYNNESDAKDIGQIGHFSNQFFKFYYTRCFADIAKERRWKDSVYKDSFWGHQLVDWLISEGLCLDDTDAEGYGQKLLEGGVIQHVTQEHLFYDAPYLYQFLK